MRVFSLLVLLICLPLIAAAQPEPAPPPRFVPNPRIGFGTIAPPEPKPLIRDEPALDWKPTGPFSSRRGGRSKLLRYYGGNEESERAVARGLAWMARQQKANGSWESDGSRKDDVVGATALALLPFLGAGEDHKNARKFKQTVLRGLQYLISKQKEDGSFGCPTDSQGMAALALCEDLGLSEDRELLLKPAQSAIDFLIAMQNKDGGWGEKPGDPSTTTALAWPSQAIRAARLGKEVKVADEPIQKISDFLNLVTSGKRRSVYGETKADGQPATTATAIGVQARCDHGKWAAGNAGLAEAMDEMLKKRLPKRPPDRPDVHFYYFATRIFAWTGDSQDEWRDWNLGPSNDGKRVGGMRDWLVVLQEKQEGRDFGSWESDGEVVGKSMGRLGTTAYSILILEVYYRYFYTYWRNPGFLK